jgi:pyoverdine/dityrosine biosynthesis protein Dit1
MTTALQISKCPSARAAAIATEIMKDIMQFRRVAGSHAGCSASEPCAECLAPHIPKVMAAIESNTPVTLVLPAFPGKSPNPNKVLGHLPDMAERRALHGRLWSPSL